MAKETYFQRKNPEHIRVKLDASKIAAAVKRKATAAAKKNKTSTL
jgi:hypothetical protein